MKNDRKFDFRKIASGPPENVYRFCIIKRIPRNHSFINCLNSTYRVVKPVAERRKVILTFLYQYSYVKNSEKNTAAKKKCFFRSIHVYNDIMIIKENYFVHVGVYFRNAFEVWSDKIEGFFLLEKYVKCSIGYQCYWSECHIFKFRIPFTRKLHRCSVLFIRILVCLLQKCQFSGHARLVKASTHIQDNQLGLLLGPTQQLQIIPVAFHTSIVIQNLELLSQ